MYIELNNVQCLNHALVAAVPLLYPHAYIPLERGTTYGLGFTLMFSVAMGLNRVTGYQTIKKFEKIGKPVGSSFHSIGEILGRLYQFVCHNRDSRSVLRNASEKHPWQRIYFPIGLLKIVRQ